MLLPFNGIKPFKNLTNCSDLEVATATLNLNFAAFKVRFKQRFYIIGFHLSTRLKYRHQRSAKVSNYGIFSDLNYCIAEQKDSVESNTKRKGNTSSKQAFAYQQVPDDLFDRQDLIHTTDLGNTEQVIWQINKG